MIIPTQGAKVVMKFGGTSVATQEARSAAVSRIRAELKAGSQPVVVVSAMGRQGDPYATDTLLSLVERDQCGNHEIDMLMSVGEVISTVVMAALLNKEGIPAKALTGLDAGIVTDYVDNAATIKLIDPTAINTTLAQGAIPVVAGFQGNDTNGILHTLGRGGSDTTACALGVALKAERVDIYTDVDGVFTADPRVIPEASPIKTITADELFQMARSGSKIVHAPAAKLCFESGIKMRVRNTFSDFEGTQVVSSDDFRPDTVATAVTTVSGIARLRVRLPDAKDDPKAHMQAQTRVYRILADADLSIDMFTPMNDRLVCSIPASLGDLAFRIVSAEGFETAVKTPLGKVTLVGSGMHGVPGVMARVAQSLWEADVDILQISDSHATISLLVDEADTIKAAQALHRSFKL